MNAFVLKGTIVYSELFEKRGKSYCITMGNLTKDDKMMLLEKGVPAKKIKVDAPEEGQRDRGLYVQAYSQRKPKVVDSAGNVVPEGTQVWSGSEGKVVMDTYDYNNEYGKGTSIGFNAVMITKLVDGSSGGGIDLSAMLIPEEDGSFIVDKDAVVFEDDEEVTFDDVVSDEEFEEVA